jgi:glutathione reductase (NADPH)
VNVGCIPKKLYSYAAHYATALKSRTASAGRRKTPCSTGTTSRPTAPREITRLNGIYVQLLETAGVKIIKGWARLLDAHTIEVDDKKPHRQTHPDLTGGTAPCLHSGA